MRRLRRFIGPGGARRTIACALGVAGAAAALWQAPDSFRAAEDRVALNARTPRADRVLLAGRSSDLDTDFFVAAARTIPADATYLVLTGNGVEVSNPTVLVKAPVFAGYFLLPRRQVSEPRLAGWVVSYGGDLDSLPLRYARRIVVSPGYVLAEVAR